VPGAATATTAAAPIGLEILVRLLPAVAGAHPSDARTADRIAEAIVAAIQERMGADTQVIVEAPYRPIPA
jgi:hypothetical protein